MFALFDWNIYLMQFAKKKKIERHETENREVKLPARKFPPVIPLNRTAVCSTS